MCWDNEHIHQTALKHKHITKYLPAVHALTECDTASYRCGFGKATALMVLMGGDEDKLTSNKAPSLLPVTDPQFKEI